MMKNYQSYGLGLLLLFLLCCYRPIPVRAQARVVYPVKQGNLWGFMSRKGELLVPPRYDAIGEQLKFLVNQEVPAGQSQVKYRMVELNGKLGIVDQNLAEILPCDNDFVLPISVTQFLVKQEAGYTILDSAGNNLPGRYFPNLEYAGTTRDGTYYYKIFDQGKQGLINSRGDTLLRCTYDEVKTLEWQQSPFLTRTRTDRGWWRLVAEQGTPLLGKIAEATAPHPGVILVTTEDIMPGQYVAYDGKGRPIKALAEYVFMRVVYLSPELVKLTKYADKQEHQTQHLFQVREEKLLLPFVTGFRYLDGDQAVASMLRSSDEFRGSTQLQTLISPRGELVDSNRWFLKVNPWPGAPGRYRVRKRNGWGVIDRSGREIIPTEYSSIGSVIDGLARIALANGQVGMITAAGRTVVAAQYNNIYRQGNLLMLYNDGGTTKLYLDDSLREVSVRQYQNLRTLNVTPPSFYRIAERGRLENLRPTAVTPPPEESEPNAGSTILGDVQNAIRNGGLETEEELNPARLTPWFYPDTARATGAYLPTPAATKLGMDTTFLARHTAPFLSLGYYVRFYAHQSLVPAADFQRLVTGTEVAVQPQRLFADRSGKLLNEAVVGFRIFDYKDGWEYAPALRRNGHFMLLNKAAEPLRDADGEIMEFTYVGDANNGLLRVCVGGVLSKPEKEEVPEHPLRSLYSLLEPFHLRTARGTLTKSMGPLVMRSLPSDSARWGVIDSLGQWVLPPVYEYLEENENRQMIAYRAGEYGVVDINGDTIVPFQYKKIRSYKGFWRVNSAKIGEVYFNWRGHQIRDVGTDSVDLFRQGYAPYLADGHWSYISDQGRALPGGPYLQARPFGEGLAAVQPDSTQWLFIDTSGQERGRLSATTFQDFSYFSAGRCRFRRGKRFGYLDKDLREIPLPTLFGRAEDFDRGSAIVYAGGGIALIDTSGNFLVEPGTFTHFSAWNAAGLAVATAPNNKKFLIDLRGKPLHETPYEEIILKGDGPYPVKLDGQWGYLDTIGNLVISPKYQVARPFAEGFARIQNRRSGGRWIFINARGRIINEKTYLKASDFSGGRAFVQRTTAGGMLLNRKGEEHPIQGCENFFVDGEFIGCNPNGVGGKDAFFADENGSQVFLNSYDQIEPFRGGEMTFVKKDGRWGIIDRRGMLLVNCKYYMFSSRPDGIFKVGPPAFGIYDRKGKMIVPPVFDELALMEKNLFRVERGGKVGYLSTDGEVIWPLQN